MKVEINFEQVIDRAKKAFGINTDKELCELIQFSQTAFVNRKKTNSLPYDELFSAAISRNVNFNYLLTGKGEMYTNTVKVSEDESTQRRIEKMCEMLYQLPEQQQREVLFAVEEKQQLYKLKDEVEALKRRA